MKDLNFATIEQMHDALQTKKVSSVEITQACIDQIKKVDPQVHAFLSVEAETAPSIAKQEDAKIKQGKGYAETLRGIPVGVKDCFCTKGVRSTNASKILENYVPPFDATAVVKLKEKGAVILGKTNTDEFTMGASTEHSAFGVTKNPYDLLRVSGGSSGGSAAAVAAGMVPYALGTDTGGSIRQPANFCGVVGLKNTYGLVSRYGAMSMASSLDTIGCLTRTVKDAAIVMDTLAGFDKNDATTSNRPAALYVDALQHPIAGMTLGVPKEYFIEGVDARIQAAVQEAIQVYTKLGVKIKEVSLPHTEYALPVYYIICPAEVSSNMSRYDGMRFGLSSTDAKTIWEQYEKTRSLGFGREVQRRIMIGTYVLSSGYYDAYYLKAQKVRTLIIQDFQQVFKEVDALITPVSPTLPFEIGKNDADPLQMYLADIFSVSANLAGICGLSLPCGFTEEKGKELPIGMQLMGNHWQEEKILRLGHAFQQETRYHERKPTL